MRVLLLLALRNLRRHRLRTWLTGLMIAGGTVLVVWSVGLNEATYERMTDLATRTATGHFQVVAEGYVEKPAINATVAEPDAAEAALAAHPDVAAVAPRVEAGGLFSAGNRTVGGLLVGVDPDAEARVTSLPRSVGRGAWLPTSTAPDGPLPIVLGDQLARQLRVEVGDEVSFVSQAADGSLAAELFTVAGVADVPGLPVAVVRIADARTLLVLGERVHRLVGVARDLARVPAIVAGVATAEGAALVGWDALLPGLAKSIETDRAGGYVFLFIVLAVVLLGVANTMAMSVFERTRELGVMLALGTTPGQLVALILAEAFWLSLGAVSGGVAVGTALNAVVGDRGIPLGSRSVEFGGVVIDRMFAENTLLGNVLFPAVIVLAGVLAAVVPALRAARLQPVAALRAE